jgi:hypothetical protein
MNYISVKGSAGKTVIFSFVMMLLFSAGAIAQTPMQQPQQQQPVKTDFDRQELEEFVDAYVASTEIQQGNEEVMIQAIEEEDLDINRFNEILSVRQNQQSAEEIDATAEEMAAFNKAAEKIMAVQQETQAEIEQQLIESKIGGEKYQQIAMAYQQSPEVQERVNKILESKMGNKQ